MQDDRRRLHLPPNPTSRGGDDPYAGVSFNYYSARSSRSNATFDQRLIAMTIDILFLTVVLKVISTLLNSESDARNISPLVLVCYFVMTQWWFGCTLGKYLVGLRLEFEYPRTTVGFFRLLLRETLGKFLSTIVLGLGFLTVLVSPQRTAWHDRLARVRTVTLKPVPTSMRSQLWRGTLMLGGIALGSLAIGLAVLLGTVTPLENIQQRLLWAGIHISGLHGSLLDGYMIEHIEWKKGDNEVDLEQVAIQIDPKRLLTATNGLHLKDVSVGRGHITWKTPEESEDAAAVADEEDSREDIFPDFMSRALDLDHLDLTDVQVNWDGKNLNVERLFVAKFVSRPDEFHFERFYMESSLFHMNLNRFGVRAGQIVMESPLQGFIKPEIDPTLLQREISFSLTAEGSSRDPDVSALLFNGQMKITKVDEDVSVEVIDASPGNYLRGYWPMSRLELKVEGRAEEWPHWPVHGNFFLQKAKVQIVDEQTVESILRSGLKAKSGALAMEFRPQLFKGNSWLSINNDSGSLKTGEGLKILYEGDSQVKQDEAFFQTSFYGAEKLLDETSREPASSEGD